VPASHTGSSGTRGRGHDAGGEGGGGGGVHDVTPVGVTCSLQALLRRRRADDRRDSSGGGAKQEASHAATAVVKACVAVAEVLLMELLL
jgi:hypothetical protein